MSESATSETITLKLEQEISSAADEATGALGRLEARIVREQGALGRLEENLIRAQSKLAALGEGAADPKAVAAFEAQKSAVGLLEAKLADVQSTLAIIAQTNAAPGTLEAAHREASALVSGLDMARARMAGLAAATGPQVNVDAYKKQAAGVAAMADRVASQKDKISGLTESLKNGGKAAGESEPPFRAIGKSMRLLGGSSGEVESKLTEMIHLFRKLGPEIAIVVAGILILGGAIGIVIGTFTKAISSAAELRDEYLKLEVAGVTLWNSQRAGTTGAAQLQSSVDKVAGSSALARDKISDYAVQLRNARFTGKQLETTLTAMSTAGAAGGDQLASQFLETAKAARYFGGDVDKLAKRIEDKFGSVAAAKLRSLDVQMLKLHENISFIFSGADIEPFLKGLQSVLSLFDRNGSGAKSLRDTVTKFTEAAIGGMLRFAITLVRAYIWLKTHKTAWDLLGMAIRGIGYVLLALGAVAAAMFAVFVAGAALSLGIFAAVGAWVANFVDQVVKAWNFFTNHSWSEIGTAMIDGLVAGLKAAGGGVLAALKSIVTGAVDGVKSMLGIHSPSSLMHHEVGYQMGAGTATGLEMSAPEVADSAASMANAGVEGAKGVSASPSSGGHVIAFQGCTFGGDLTEGKLRAWMLRILEGESLDGGAPA